MAELSGVPDSNLMDAATVAGIRSRYGDEWLAQLADIVRHEVARLRLRVDIPLSGGRTACVLKVYRGSSALVLKLTPDLGRSEREAAAIARLAAAGICPQLVEAWTAHCGGTSYHGMLLRLAGDGSSLRDRPESCPSTEVLAALLYSIGDCGQEPLDVALDPVSHHVRKSLDRGAGGGLHGTPPPRQREKDWATAELERLEKADPITWVHGTLHPANLVLVEQRRLLAIDPRPFAAEREYDIAELSLKLGSERRGRSHNVSDGLVFLDELTKWLSFDQPRAENWLRVIAASGV